jgi:hypothetical protein
LAAGTQYDLPPLGIAQSSRIVASFAWPAATKFVEASAAQGGHGHGAVSLKSRAGVAIAESAASSSRAVESTNTTGGFSDYLQAPSVAVD